MLESDPLLNAPIVDFPPWDTEVAQLERAFNPSSDNHPRFHGSLAAVGVDKPSVDFQRGFSRIAAQVFAPPLYVLQKLTRYRGESTHDFQRRKHLLSSAVTSRDDNKDSLYSPSYMPKSRTYGQKKDQGRKRANAARASKRAKTVKAARDRRVKNYSTLRTKAGPRRPPALGARKGAITRVNPAATNYGVVNKGTNNIIMRSTRPGCMRMRCRIYLGPLQYSNVPNTVFTPTGANLTGGQWYFNPASQWYVGTFPISLIAQYFEAYYVNAAWLEYTSHTPTSSDLTVTWGSTENVDYAESSNVLNATTGFLKSQVLQMQTSTSFPAWTPAKALPINFVRGKRFNMRTPAGTTGSYAYGHDIATQRQCYASLCGLLVEGTTPTVPLLTLGDIFLEYDIDFCDLAGAWIVAPALRDNTPQRRSDLKIAELEKSLADIQASLGIVDLNDDAKTRVPSPTPSYGPNNFSGARLLREYLEPKTKKSTSNKSTASSSG